MAEYVRKCVDISRGRNPFSSIATISYTQFLPKLYHFTKD